ncbi:hypothetical protein EBL87_06590 [Cereibacter sphaeroides]|nr:hypothetical protein DQL45_09625 [Cereibacter sphaeroides 2.4.1]AZB63411.1 hypothetical protein EBL87_06590 [Cereibacter sphaeroides]AZB68669.1 hypothetical protein EBL86_09875 [Cereibacter sphaeroides]GEM91148.1 hypothetical protein RSP03_02150 [Cereibacter sphaeroides]
MSRALRTHVAERFPAPPTRLCAWCGKARRTVCDRWTAAAQKIDPRHAEPIRDRIEQGRVLRDRRIG